MIYKYPLASPHFRPGTQKGRLSITGSRPLLINLEIQKPMNGRLRFLAYIRRDGYDGTFALMGFWEGDLVDLMLGDNWGGPYPIKGTETDLQFQSLCLLLDIIATTQKRHRKGCPFQNGVLDVIMKVFSCL